MRHVDHDRTVYFGAGAVEAAAAELADPFHLVTTERAVAMAPAIADRAAGMSIVPPGLVEDVSVRLAHEVEGERIVALGGGRVVDVAKAIASVAGPATVIAIPTTLSGAEMTGHHRLPAGSPSGTRRVRPAVVINDPAMSASAPEHLLAASTANALAHAVAAATGTRAPGRAAALGMQALPLLVNAWSGGTPDREALARGAMLAGWAVDLSGLGPHHAIAQEAVRAFGVPHASANAAVLPGTIATLRERAPGSFARIDAVVPDLDAAVQRLRDIGGVDAPNNAWLQEDVLERALDAVSVRAELALVEPPLGRCEVRSIYTEAARCEVMLR